MAAVSSLGREVCSFQSHQDQAKQYPENEAVNEPLLSRRVGLNARQGLLSLLPWWSCDSEAVTSAMTSSTQRRDSVQTGSGLWLLPFVLPGVSRWGTLPRSCCCFPHIFIFLFFSSFLFYSFLVFTLPHLPFLFVHLLLCLYFLPSFSCAFSSSYVRNAYGKRSSCLLSLLSSRLPAWCSV